MGLGALTNTQPPSHMWLDLIWNKQEKKVKVKASSFQVCTCGPLFTQSCSLLWTPSFFFPLIRLLPGQVGGFLTPSAGVCAFLSLQHPAFLWVPQSHVLSIVVYIWLHAVLVPSMLMLSEFQPWASWSCLQFLFCKHFEWAIDLLIPLKSWVKSQCTILAHVHTLIKRC